jgi:hypothetical protein
MEAKEWSTSRRHTAENSDDVSKRAGMYISGEGKSIFEFYNTYTHGMDYIDQYLWSYLV